MCVCVWILSRQRDPVEEDYSGTVRERERERERERKIKGTGNKSFGVCI